MEKLLVFNWKMNPSTYDEAIQLLSETIELSKKAKEMKIVACLPFTWLTDLSHKYGDTFGFGGQDVFWEDKGAYTGEISPIMLINSKVKYAIVGHSERRKELGETDEIVSKKVSGGFRSGLKIILCIGEDLIIRQKGREELLNHIRMQLEKGLIGEIKSEDLIIAYEPIWAIGTGISATPDDALEAIKFIKDFMKTRFRVENSKVLYGGSVNGENIENFIKHDEIDGVLVGGASLNPKQFESIIR